MNRWNNLIDLKGDSAPMEVINQRILSDATIEGTNLIVLVMARPASSPMHRPELEQRRRHHRRHAHFPADGLYRSDGLRNGHI